jgi:hypothetical protein
MRYVVLVVCVFAGACAGATPTAPTSSLSQIDGGVGVTAPLNGNRGGIAPQGAKGGSTLPFKGTFQGTETEDGAPHHLLGSGEASHLGRFTLAAEYIVNQSVLTASGTAVWTAANGDQLFTDASADAVLEFPIIRIAETQIITGGTGRFTSASGSIFLAYSFDVQRYPFEVSGSMTGTINLRD